MKIFIVQIIMPNGHSRTERIRKYDETFFFEYSPLEETISITRSKRAGKNLESI